MGIQRHCISTFWITLEQIGRINGSCKSMKVTSFCGVHSVRMGVGRQQIHFYCTAQ